MRSRKPAGGWDHRQPIMSSVIGVSLTLPRHEFVVSQHKKASISPLDDQGKFSDSHFPSNDKEAWNTLSTYNQRF